MKQSVLEKERAYTNGSKGKWNSQRRIDKIEGNVVFYTVVGGRNQGRTGTMTKAGFAAWAAAEVSETENESA